jgi:hypothetical protein
MYDSAELLRKIVEARIHQARGISGYLENLFKAPASILSPGPEAAALCKFAYTVFGPFADVNIDKRLVNSGRSVDAMVSSVLGILVASSQSECSLPVGQNPLTSYVSQTKAKPLLRLSTCTSSPSMPSTRMLFQPLPIEVVQP